MFINLIKKTTYLIELDVVKMFIYFCSTILLENLKLMMPGTLPRVTHVCVCVNGCITKESCLIFKAILKFKPEKILIPFKSISVLVLDLSFVVICH